MFEVIEADRISRPENLVWAWLKVKRAYSQMDSVFDQGEVALFDLELERNLGEIGEALRAGDYRCDALRFLPQPKRQDDDGNPRMREAFLPTVRDQVAWMAVLNAIGASYDVRMPGWSYGNRLYRAAWYEREADGRTLKELLVGPYRNTTGHTYRRFKHSWPLFRRHLSLVARAVALNRPLEKKDLAETEEGAWHMGRTGSTRLEYFDGLNGRREGTKLYHATFDLENFYPSLTSENVMNGLGSLGVLDPKVTGLIETMMRFTVDRSYGDELYVFADPAKRKAVPDPYDRVPTGLMVSGFLANVAMLPVDQEVEKRFLSERTVAHFRYVDDHALLSRDFSALMQWIDWYEDKLSEHGIKSALATGKYDPSAVEPARGNADAEKFEEARKACEIDGAKPVKLATRTLALVSILAGVEPEVLADGPRTTHLEQLKWLLLANVPDTEIRADTRASFAAGRIASMTPGHHKISPALVQMLRCKSGKGKKGVDADAVVTIVNPADLTTAEEEDRRARLALLSHHFDLLLDAAKAHPDKPRLFQRVIEYCRRTGHRGLAKLRLQLSEGGNGDCYVARRRYFTAFANQLLARWLVDAASAVGDQTLLHRERHAAHEFLLDACAMGADAFGSKDDAGFARGARRALLASYGVAAARLVEVARRSKRADLLKIVRKLRSFAFASADTPALGFAIWQRDIGLSHMTWLHWGETIAPSGDVAPIWWPAALEHADFARVSDRNASRRYPSKVSDRILQAIADDLAESDAGWVIDVMRMRRAPVVSLSDIEAVRLALDASETDGGSASLYEWIDGLKSAEDHDPRLTEWTALTLVAQLIRPHADLDLERMQPLEVARRLHPSNVRIPGSWSPTPTRAEPLTWEAWRGIATQGPSPFLRPHPIQDYRYSVDGGVDNGLTEQLHAIGCLLWGMFRRDFTLPVAWNIRGHDRAVLRRLYADLERLPISSESARLLRACLTPRGAETALLRTGILPSLIAGLSDDTEFELKFLNLPEVRREIERIIKALRDEQVTVMDHQPRQLVPVRLSEAAKASEPEEADNVAGA